MDIDLEAARRVVDYAEHGGAPLLNVNGVTIIGHGDSPPGAIRHARRVATRSGEGKMVEHLKRELSGLASGRS